MTGTVMDSSGAVVPEAKMELRHTGTGVVRSTSTSEAGLYRFDAVDLGSYDLRVAKAGFKTFVSTSLNVEPNRPTTLDPVLEVGALSDDVTVSAQTADLLVKDAPLRGGNFTPKEVSRLPLSGRNAIALAATLPGVLQPRGAGTRDPSVAFSVNGQRPRGNNFLFDGMENNNNALGGPNQPLTMTDAVEVLSA